MYVAGLMSGTSLDGVDAVVMNPENHQVIASDYEPYDDSLKQTILKLISGATLSFASYAEVNARLADVYANLCLRLIKKSKVAISVIGCHGQAVYHAPNDIYPLSLQLGCPHQMAKLTKLPVVCDFRQADVVRGGQGAPLAPLYHAQVFALKKTQVVVNLGGIANISYINGGGRVTGFDTGPANALMDHWMQKHCNKPFDKDGEYALSGMVQSDLLDLLLSDPYFKKTPPKSLDKTTFDDAWLNTHLNAREYRPEDVQRTLLQFTIETVTTQIKQFVGEVSTIILSGGGAKNPALLDGFKAHFDTVYSSKHLGFEPEHIEAMLIAWLAHKRLKREALDLSSITGSEGMAVLGSLVLP